MDPEQHGIPLNAIVERCERFVSVVPLARSIVQATHVLILIVFYMPVLALALVVLALFAVREVAEFVATIFAISFLAFAKMEIDERWPRVSLLLASIFALVIIALIAYGIVSSWDAPCRPNRFTDC